MLDAGTGVEIFGKDADQPRAIASTTKIFVALAVRRAGVDLEAYTEITREDVRAARGGAKTRLDLGQSFRNIDLMRAMLMASDNRAPTALGRGAGLSPKQLIAAMNAVAKDLGLKKTKFTDTSGLRGNVSTAREMALAIRAALEDDVIRDIMGTDYVVVKSQSGYAKIGYGTTDQVLGSSRWHVIGGKTGYTEAAGYCFVVGAEIAGRPLVMAFLGADGKHARFGDFERIAEWVDAGAPGSKVKVKPAKARTAPRLSVSARGRAEP
ncbi:MAG: serine hydrolase [Deltaproteobacteria bacterium]|nr:serine hydrolase [Deltaproteobacteria bacterium]